MSPEDKYILLQMATHFVLHHLATLGGLSWTIVGEIPTIDFTLFSKESKMLNNRIPKIVIMRTVENRHLKC